MIAFIDDHRAVYGVEPICRVLPIAPSSYRTHAARAADPEKRPDRAKRDAALRPEIQRVWEENFRVYSVRKVWRQLNREGTAAARCTVARLMAEMGLAGAVRGKAMKTTVPDPAAPCPEDRVNRAFHSPAPNRLWLSDFTYVATWVGFVYVALVIDAFARRIVGWRVSRSMQVSSSSMPSSRRCTSGGPSGTPAWFTTSIAARNTDRGAASRPSSLPRSNGSTGTTTAACSSRSETSRRQKPRPASMRNPVSSLWGRDPNQPASGKSGAVQFTSHPNQPLRKRSRPHMTAPRWAFVSAARAFRDRGDCRPRRFFFVPRSQHTSCAVSRSQSASLAASRSFESETSNQ